MESLAVLKLETLKPHNFIAKQQASYLNSVKENLLPGEFLVIGDFSENYSFVVQDKAQSFHWNNSMTTIHPFAYYYRNAGDIYSVDNLVSRDSWYLILCKQLIN